MQQVGRGIRRAEDKTDCLILDHAGNVIRHGLPVHFEVPDLQARDRERQKRQNVQGKMVPCSNCSFALEPGQQICPNCGLDRPRRPSDIETVDGELVEYGSVSEGAGPTVAERRNFHRQLLWIAQERGYSRGWAYHKHREKFGVKPKWDWQQLQPEPPTRATLRWIKSRQIRHAKGRAAREAQHV